MDNLGLAMPSNTDELYDVLRAFRTGDPTGTGAEVIPWLATHWGIGWTDNGIQSIAYWWGISATDIGDRGLFRIGNELKLGMIEPEFKDILAWASMMFADGLMDQDFGTGLVPDDQQAKIENNEGGFWHDASFRITRILNNMAETNPSARFSGVPHFVNPADGKAWYVHAASVLPFSANNSIAISGNATNPEGLAQFLNFFYTDEAINLTNFGVEGITYDYNAQGEPILRREALYDILPESMERNPGNLQGYFYPGTSPYAGIPGIELASGTIQKSLSPASSLIVDAFKEGDISRVVPGILPSLRTSEQVARAAEIMEAFNSGTALGERSYEEVIHLIIRGEEPLSLWDNVVTDMRRAGIEDWLADMQDCYDRFQRR
jgi:putative aldouronate transport system substrate-binding protein